MTSETYRARFRFRVLKKLAIDQPERRLVVGGREVVLSALVDGGAINASEWLVINARGFASEDEATLFVKQLGVAAEVSAAATRLGIDAGRDVATSALAPAIRRQLQEALAVDYRDNVHGADVFLDEPNVRFFSIAGTLTVLANPEPFLNGIGAFLCPPDKLSAEARDVVLLLNYALMRPDPVSQIVFSVSAVEMLGQEQDWSPAQRQLLVELEAAARQSPIGSEIERAEVAEAVTRGLRKASLRQGVLRLLGELGLGHLKKRWDQLYSERSELVHGLAPRPGADYGSLANRTVALCGHILTNFIARELPLVGQHAATFYGLD